METILQLKGLTKQYGDTKVVDNFSLSIEKGHIYGLIGPNGAGKTTIMKMIGGTCMPSSGSIAMFGSEDNLEKSRSRASFMIEAPYIDGSMTAEQNMEYIRYMRGVAKKEKIAEILEFVGLDKTGNKKAKLFSLGMRQRLGIGMALLPSPEIMILDEPVNGLDPEGIVEVRNMLRMLCYENGITILISSHLLSELSELCTDFAIIDHGCLVECLSKEDLNQKCRSFLSVSVDEDKTEQLTTILEQKLDIREYKVMEGNEIRIYEQLEDIRKISKTITDNGLTLTKLNLEGENLEQYYLSKVSASKQDADAKPSKKIFKRGGK